MALGLELFAFRRELFDLQAVHQKGHLEIMAREQIGNSPDADPVAVFTLRYQCHILLKNCFRRRKGGTAVALQRIVGGKIFRPNLPWHNEGHTDFGFIRPFYRFWSAHDFSFRSSARICSKRYIAARMDRQATRYGDVTST